MHHCIGTRRLVLARRRREKLLGENILGIPGADFDIEIHVGAGAYVCGEESALIESLEGKRGTPRNRPPFPVTNGYLDQPTIVNNVETFAAAAMIALKGGEWYAGIGTKHSAGTKILSVSGDCARPGIYEYPFGVSVRQVLDYVARGEVDAGFVYRTDAKQLADKVDVIMIVEGHDPVSYPIAVATTGKDAKMGQEFLNFVLSPEGQAVLAKYGFSKP